MNGIDVGWLSLIPPILAIGLALTTKEVVASLLTGIFSGTLIYAFYQGEGLGTAVYVAFNMMGEKVGENIFILIFIGLLGTLVAVVTLAGGAKAYGTWVATKINSRRGAQLATFILGIVIFIDDYFNCLTIGTVMRPVTDKQRISREKLAYIIDATAAPVCILAPISSWAASVISQIDSTNAGLDGMSTFLDAIPFNLYAILTLLMVLILCIFPLEFGSMAKFEKAALDGKLLDESGLGTLDEGELENLTISENGKVIDLILPIVILIILSIISMLYLGGYFSGVGSVKDAFANTDAGMALVIGGFGALISTFILFVPRKLVKFKDFMSCITIGERSMVGATIILILAWTISGVCRELLNTGGYVGALVANSNISPAFIPVIIFIVAGFLSFAMGTSWGTFTILIPIIVSVCQQTAVDLMTIAISATLAGSVLGDHCSPISDTTILSSTGAGCRHINHVSSQLPYVLVVGFSNIIGYLVAGFTKSLWLTLLISIIVLIISLIILHHYTKTKID